MHASFTQRTRRWCRAVTCAAAVLLAAGTPGIYNTTKFAVRGLSESLHYSLLQYEIGVSVLCPGLVKSYIYASDDIRPDELKVSAPSATSRRTASRSVSYIPKYWRSPCESNTST